MEWKVVPFSGVAGVYCPVNQKVEWKQAFNSGVAGVYNPATQQVEWKQVFKSGVAGVSTIKDYYTLQSYSFYGIISDFN